MFVCQLRASFTSFGQLLRCAHKRIVMKVYIERYNMQVELIRFSQKISLFFHVYFYEARNPTRPMCLRLESRYINLPVRQ